MSEDSMIVIDYSDIRRTIGENPEPHTTTPIENWNYSNSASFNPTLPTKNCSISPFAMSKFSVSMFIAIGSVVTIILVVFMFCVALLVKTVNSRGSVGTGETAGNKITGGNAFFLNDDSKFDSRKKNSVVHKFRNDVFKTESGIEKNFDYKYLQWSSDEDDLQNVINKYQKASAAISEWVQRLAEIDVNSINYQDVPNKIKEDFERYRKSATALNDVFTSYVIDEGKIQNAVLEACIAGLVGNALGSALGDEEDGEDLGRVGVEVIIDNYRNEYNNQIRSISTYCSSCASERNAFEKSCSL